MRVPLDSYAMFIVGYSFNVILSALPWEPSLTECLRETVTCMTLTDPVLVSFSQRFCPFFFVSPFSAIPLDWYHINILYDDDLSGTKPAKGLLTSAVFPRSTPTFCQRQHLLSTPSQFPINQSPFPINLSPFHIQQSLLPINQSPFLINPSLFPTIPSPSPTNLILNHTSPSPPSYRHPFDPTAVDAGSRGYPRGLMDRITISESREANIHLVIYVLY